MHQGTAKIVSGNTGRKRSLLHGATEMLYWAVVFLVIALVAAVLGFGGIAGTAIGIAKIIFFVAIILFLISAIFGYRGRGTPRL
jgi:uncharacterized membrane protein YtjA (UPF0391 family)